jgi:hypothetical protein
MKHVVASEVATIGQKTGSFSERTLCLHEYEFLKAYLHAVFVGTIPEPALRIVRCVAKTSLSDRPLVPRQVDAGSPSFPLIGDDTLSLTLEWSGGLYDVNVSREFAMPEGPVTTAYCLGLAPAAANPKELLREIITKAVGNSLFKNEVVQLAMDSDGDRLQMRTVSPKDRSLSALCLSGEVADAMTMFVHSVQRYRSLRIPLRYLFSGKPGTGKTETIRAAIHACKRNATFVLVEPGVDLKAAFEFAGCFDPAVLCLDDVDLLCGDRRHGRQRNCLSDFLALMDGFVPSNVFVLATTNDKELVDQAASRPGRFDAILDFCHLERKHYQRLIEERSSILGIAALFDDDILRDLEDRRVSGAFIVTLLKNLELRQSLGGESIDRDAVLKIIDNLYRGFYQRPDECARLIGFAMEN